MLKTDELKTGTGWARAAQWDELRASGRMTVQLDGQTVVLFAQGERVYALDNRCPHMGFPLDRGTLKDGILTCHWHHARFDMESGGTFDLFADDVRCFPAQVRDGEVWVDLRQPGDRRQHQRQRLQVGLERDIPLVIGKAVLSLLDAGENPAGPFQAGLEYGTAYRRAGWGQGLTILTCMANLLPFLEAADRPRALYQGLSAVAGETAGSPPRFPIRSLPGEPPEYGTLKGWFRRFIEVRDGEGGERCLATAIRAGAKPRQIAEMLFTSATDHRYLQIGHVVDFTNKAFEALEVAGWEYAEPVLTSLVSGYANADRMEESNAWRNPIDLVAILEGAFERLPGAWEAGLEKRAARDVVAPAGAGPGIAQSHAGGAGWNFGSELIQILLGDEPQAITSALLEALSAGLPGEELASAVSYAAALRIARFHTSNEFGDWDTALHTFTFANAIEAGFRRAPSLDLLRGVFDAAMSIYLDRFLNIPPARLPRAEPQNGDPQELLEELPALLDRQQQVNTAGDLAARFLGWGGGPAQLQATLGKLLLREDRNFHTIQTVEAAVRQYGLQRDPQAKVHVLVAAARYLAAHAPTVRAQGQTYEIVTRLQRGERVFEEND